MTDKDRDLVEELLTRAHPSNVHVTDRAAARIQTQAREIERLNTILSDMNDTDVIAKTMAENERLRLDVEAQEALQVSAYHAGLRAGWNFGVSDDNAGMQAAMANTDHIKELRRIREARAALAGDSHD